jgi:anti-sigma factor RsiW
MPVTSNCKSIRACFAPYVDDTLGEEETRQLQQHLSSCPDCLAELAAARQAMLIIRRLQEEDVSLPAGFPAQLMQRILAGDLTADLIDFSWQGLLATLLQLMELFFGMLLGSAAEVVVEPAS